MSVLLAVLLSVSTVTSVTIAFSAGPAAAATKSSPPPKLDALPNPAPSAITPQVDDGEVWGVAEVGDLMVIGGNFTSVGGQPRAGLAAFNSTTGALSSTFAPTLAGGQVYSLFTGPTANTVYVAGDFTSVNGAGQPYLALLDTTTGQAAPGFTAPTFNFGGLRDITKVGNRLYAGGFFTQVNGQARQGLASMNATTGALDSYLTVQLAGHHNDTGSGSQGFVGPWALDSSPDGSRLIVTGNFKTADGLLRDQLVMIDLNTSSAVVDPNWATARYSPYCFNWAFDGYTRGVSFSPDGSYFVVNATGGGVPGSLCDAVSRFETASTGTSLNPTWVDETGGDTEWGVTVTSNAVYIGGHNRWSNNPLGVDQAKPGAVPRAGMAALDPVSGRPYAWNPGHRPLGKAVYALLATSKGLWMGYDQDYIGNNYQYLRKKIAFFPYAGGPTLASTTTGKLPGTVYRGTLSSNSPSNVLYRVNTGGSALASSDGGPTWTEDSTANPSPYVTKGTSTANTYSTSISKLNASVPSTTPRAIFDSERVSNNDSPSLAYNFPVPAGTKVAVRMYFANRCTCVTRSGQRKFNVWLNGTTVLSKYDVVADAGNQTGTMKTFDATVPSNGRVAITFTHNLNNPIIDGIEIVNKSAATPTAPTDTLSSIGFDGTTATAPQPVTGTSIPWGSTKGAFVVGKKLFYGSSDGFLYSAPIDGSSIGTPTKVDPYMDPLWVGVPTGNGNNFDGAYPQFYGQLGSVSGMFYSGGKVYFTMTGDSTLRSAWFSPDSGIIDQTETTVPSSVNFSDADGMFVSGDTLYFARLSTGSLYSVGFSNGAVTGTPTLVNGPANGGVDWTNKSMFFVPAPAANTPPKAAFSSSCAAGGCAVDATDSSDADGSIASYAWDFGDGSNGTGVQSSHSYGSTGTYTVKLTVTDDRGATDTISHDVSVSSLAKQISFVGASHSDATASLTKSVKVPAGTAVGDTIVAVQTVPTGQGWGSPGADWTQVSSITNVSIASTVWVKTATAADVGGTVTMSATTASKAMLSLTTYNGVSTTKPVGAFARSGDAGGFSHTTPTLTATAGDTLVSFWTDKSAGVSSWTEPAGVVKRDAAYGTGASGRMGLLVADSGGPVAGGTYGALTATTDTSSDKAIMWTLALKPASVGNVAPTASFTSSCSSSTCSFDGTGSADSDGSVASYAWDFGDSTNGNTASPSHTYATPGTYTVTLTVTDDGGATDTKSAQVTTKAADPVTYVGTARSATGTTAAKSVTVPTAAAVGDTMLLVLTGSGTWSSPGAGWTQVSTLTNVSIFSTVWVKQVAPTDTGSTISLTNSAGASKASLSMAVYRGVSGSNPISVAKGIGDAGGTTHTTPTVAASAGDLVASFWTDKSAGVTTWTPPSNVTKRSDTYDTGAAARFSVLFADSLDPVPAGNYGGLTATTDTASDKAIMWTIALRPAG